MSTDAISGVDVDDDDTSREVLINQLDDAIAEAHEKAVDGRVYDAENEKVRQGWLRVVGYLAGQKRQLLKDKELDEMAERIAALEEAKDDSL